MTDFTAAPKTATTISSSELAAHFKDVLAMGDRVQTAYTQTNASLNLTITVGEAYISGYRVGLAGDSDVVKALTGNATNYVFINYQGNITVNTTGTPPAQSLQLFTVVAGASTVTSVDATMQDATVYLQEPAKFTKVHVTSTTPADADELTSKTYVDAAITAAGNVKLVRAASTVNLTLSGTQTIDGVACIAGDRVLAKDQTTGSEDGIYVVASGAWSRSTDFAVGSGTVNSGVKVGVSEGTVSADATYRLDTNGTIVVGTTALVFTLDSVTGQRGTANGLATLTSGVHTLAERSYATTSNRGGVTLSTAPASSTVPIAVGDNDARVTADQAAGTASIRTIGTGALQATAGNDSRLSDTRTPTDNTTTTVKIVDDAVTNAKAANMAQATIKGRAAAAGTGDPTDLTPTQAVAVLNNASEFDTQVRTNRLDQMAAPTTDVSFNSHKLTNLLAPVAASDGARLDTVTGRAPTYAEVDATVEASTGDTVSQGPAQLHAANVSSPSNLALSSLPGAASYASHTTAPAAAATVTFSPVANQGTTSPATIGSIVPGYSLSLKGIIKSSNGTRLDSTSEKFALGAIVSASDLASTGLGAADFASTTEGTRDDEGTIAIVVDGSNNIQSYNCAAAGDASYTDSTFDADLTLATGFEIIISCPSTYNSFDDLAVTIKLMDNGGTMRTVLNAVAPVGTDSGNTCVNLIMLLNVRCSLSKLTYKVAKVA